MNQRKELLSDFCQANDLNEENRDDLARAVEYVRLNTNPVLIFIENLADMASNLDMMTEMLLDGCFKGMRRYNMRAIAFFEPRDEKRCRESVLYSGYALNLSLIHISEPTRLGMISYAVFCLKKKKTRN